MRMAIVILLIVSCSTSNDEKLRLQSVETHNLAIKIGEHVSDKIDRIGLIAKSLDEPNKSVWQDSARVLSQDYLHWDSTIIEVPGNEHQELSHSGHNHTQVPNLTPVMLLDIQKDLRDRIVKLNIRAQNILEILNKESNNEPVEEKEKASRYGA